MSLLWVKKLVFQNFSKVGTRFNSAVSKAFTKEAIVPDLLEKAPSNIAEIYYKSGVIVNLGNSLCPINVKDKPKVMWPAEQECFYSLCLLDIDVPSRKEPKQRALQHWLVGNIPGCKLDKGKTLTEYLSPIPGKGTCLHRYVLLIYQQEEEVCFDDIPLICGNSICGREKFSIQDFACEFKLGDPFAGNFYQSECDSYVKEVLKKLGIEE